MVEKSWPAWQERVGARHVSWWQEVLVFIPLGTLSVVFANADSIKSVSDFLQWFLVALVGSLSGSAIFALLMLRLNRMHRRGIAIKPALVVISGLVIGMVFGIGVALAETVMGLPIADPWWFYIVGSGIIIGWLGITISLVLDARTRLRDQRAQLVEEAIALELARITTTSIVEEMREQVADNVESTLVNARTALDERIIKGDVASATTHWPQLAEILRNTATETVRPLSRELWDAASEPFHRKKPWSIFKFVLEHQPLRPIAVSVIFLMGSGSRTVQQEGTYRGLLMLGLSAFLILAIMGGANALMRRYPQRHTQFFVAASVLLQVPVVVNYLVIESQGVVATSFLEVIGTVLSGFVVIYITSAFGALLKVNVEQLSVVAADIDREFVMASARNKALARVLRDASSILHGTIQGKLLACAMSVENAGQASNIEHMSEALEQARQELEKPLPGLTRSPLVTTLPEELERRKALWHGLCEVHIESDDSLREISAKAVQDCSLIVEEAIANAIRHGDARSVLVRVELDQQENIEFPQLRITVSDDGCGLIEGNLIQGVGISMISDLASSWSLTTVEGHGFFEAKLALH